MLRIGEVATRAGVSVRAVRYYEQQGLLSSTRTSGGQRRYPASVVGRVRLLQHFYLAGLTSRTISDVLPLIDEGEPDPALTARLQTELDRLDQHIRALQDTRGHLQGVVAASTTFHPGCAASTDQVGAT